MNILYYPDQGKVELAAKADDPLLVLISFDGSRLLAAPADDSMEHLILLKQLGFPELDIDKYFRVVVNKSGADWTFVCPQDYKNVADKTRRVERFYNDGFKVISNALKKIGYDVPLEIPRRYQRHVDFLKNGEA